MPTPSWSNSRSPKLIIRHPEDRHEHSHNDRSPKPIRAATGMQGTWGCAWKIKAENGPCGGKGQVRANLGTAHLRIRSWKLKRRLIARKSKRADFETVRSNRRRNSPEGMEWVIKVRSSGCLLKAWLRTLGYRMNYKARCSGPRHSLNICWALPLCWELYHV